MLSPYVIFECILLVTEPSCYRGRRGFDVGIKVWNVVVRAILESNVGEG